MLSFSILYPDLIKVASFVVDLTQRGDRGWKEAQREDEDKATLRKTLLYHWCLSLSNSQKGLAKKKKNI